MVISHEFGFTSVHPEYLLSISGGIPSSPQLLPSTSDFFAFVYSSRSKGLVLMFKSSKKGVIIFFLFIIYVRGSSKQTLKMVELVCSSFFLCFSFQLPFCTGSLPSDVLISLKLWTCLLLACAVSSFFSLLNRSSFRYGIPLCCFVYLSLLFTCVHLIYSLYACLYFLHQ